MEEYYAAAQTEQAVMPSLPASGGQPIYTDQPETVSGPHIPTQPSLYT